MSEYTPSLDDLRAAWSYFRAVTAGPGKYEDEFDRAMAELDSYEEPAPEPFFWDDRTTGDAYDQQDSERDLALNLELLQIFNSEPSELPGVRAVAAFGFSAGVAASAHVAPKAVPESRNPFAHYIGGRWWR